MNTLNQARMCTCVTEMYKKWQNKYKKFVKEKVRQKKFVKKSLSNFLLITSLSTKPNFSFIFLHLFLNVRRLNPELSGIRTHIIATTWLRQ